MRSLGRFELMTHCDNEQWVTHHITQIGRASLRTVLESKKTLLLETDLKDSIQGVILEEAFRTVIRQGGYKQPCGVLRCIGATAEELEFAKAEGVDALIDRMKDAQIYPKTILDRASVV